MQAGLLLFVPYDFGSYRLEFCAHSRHVRGMCNAMSPERSVIWSVLHGLAPHDAPDALSGEHFTHPTYRMWFDAVCGLRGAKREINDPAIHDILLSQGHTMRDIDRRALKRMLRLPPPTRIAENTGLLCQALRDRHQGLSVHIERLIN